MKLRMLFLLVAVAATVAPAATAASAALTKEQAFARASKCLKAHGARDVLPRAGNHGGLAQYGGTTRGTAAFKYELRGDMAVGVELWFTTSSSGGPTKVERQWAQRCVSWGVPLLKS